MGKTPVAIIPPWLQYIYFFFCICGTEKLSGSSGRYLKFRWWDLYGVVGIQPPFLARAEVRNSACHTSFHTACQICGIWHIHTLMCCLLGWSSVHCARQHAWKSWDNLLMPPCSPPQGNLSPKQSPLVLQFQGGVEQKPSAQSSVSVMGQQMAAMRQIYNSGIVAEVNFCYPVLDVHHKTLQIFPVCFKCSFISDITIHLFLKASFSSICSRGETKACQLKCLWFSWFFVFFFFISPPFSPLLPIKFLLPLLPFSFSCRALLFQGGMLWFPTRNMCLVSPLPPFLAFCGDGSAFLPFHAGEGADAFLQRSSGQEATIKSKPATSATMQAVRLLMMPSNLPGSR